MAPLKFIPIYKSIIWGGNKIASYKNIESIGESIGESWEIADIDGNVSQIANSEYNGMTVHNWIATFREKAVGKKVYDRFGNNFPLLIKLIDAQDDLSIQVHPNDEVAEQRHGSKGKTEMWYVIDADSDTTLVAGFNKKLTREELKSAIEKNTIFEHLAVHQVRKGDVYFLPSGRVHAIRKGTLIAEIQQSSNITYRIYDYNRVDKDGNPRQMHVEESTDVITLEHLKQANLPYVVEPNQASNLLSCEYFTTNILQLSGKEELSRNLSSEDSFVVYMIIEGKGELSSDNGRTFVSIVQGETILVPFEETGKIRLKSSAEGLKLLEVYL